MTPAYPSVERHPLREWVCQHLGHGLYEEHEVLHGKVQVDRLSFRSCGRGHLWKRVTW